MSGTALLQVQTAVRDALQGDAGLSSLVTGIFDHVPPSQPFPFVVLGEKSEKDFSTFSRGGASVSLLLEIRSRAEGDAELLSIYHRIKEVLHHQPLPLSGFSLVYGRTELLKTALDPDGVTRRGEARYEVLAQEA